MPETTKSSTLTCPPLPLVLGSSSKFRRAVLDAHQIPYTVQIPHINEEAFGDRLHPSLTASVVANAKMDALLSRWDYTRLPHSILVTCDQVVSWNGEVREKPKTEDSTEKGNHRGHTSRTDSRNIVDAAVAVAD
ncbi:hypothetical protein SeLEV6574_g05737 [Synchytrium endobioticum]|uniref:Uncharacterized protein n=1 Tax=Synchytrium endobioticum TaxID=286115 RepID=A0A507CSP3_9FUNG|nr:hypothetical protein SeLEV6574_g05737 [Synchytrium endobioticum]